MEGAQVSGTDRSENGTVRQIPRNLRQQAPRDEACGTDLDDSRRLTLGIRAKPGFGRSMCGYRALK